MPWWTSGPDRDAGKHRVLEMRDSAEIFAPVELIWDLLRPAEYAPLLVPGAVRGYADPPAEGVGEIHHLVAKRARKEFHAACEILEENPHRRLVARSWGQTGPAERFELRLEPTEKGTLVERICTHHHHKWSLVPASACRKQHSQWHRREFTRIQELLDGGWTPDSVLSGMARRHGDSSGTLPETALTTRRRRGPHAGTAPSSSVGSGCYSQATPSPSRSSFGL